METTAFSQLAHVEIERCPSGAYLFRLSTATGFGPQRYACEGSAEHDACRHLDVIIDTPGACPQQEAALVRLLQEADNEARTAELARLFQPEAFPLMV